ncbi:MAG TPA: MoxR family ATPase [Candidatus Spyradocola merdavium]|nr:MoxR family ATPase [Candidatus Spyradocola merdavium]
MEIEKTLQSIREVVARAVVGKGEAVDLVLTALLCGGHVLIEDVPGVGKTTLVRALAAALGLSFRRIQFTPDLTPSDVTGFTLVDLRTGETRRVEGAVMRQLILADEINRTGPKTQSALLEVMQEGQVTVDGETVPVPRPFLVLATQNPLGLAGTYPLPEAQLDRFLLCVHMGYPAPGEEVRILDLARGGTRPEDLPAVTSAAEILEMQRRCREVKTTEAVKQYVVRIAEETRRDRNVSLGASPRASLMLLTASMAWALLHGRDYVLPDDVQRLAVPVLAHRIRLKAQAGYQQRSAEDVVRAIVGSLRVPTGL